MNKVFRIAMCQMKVENDKKANLEKACGMIETAAQNNADMAVLPEMFICPYVNDSFLEYSEKKTSGTVLK